MKTKKVIITCLLAGIFSVNAYSHVDLLGIFIRINQQSFCCAMVSTKLCARVSRPDTGEEPHTGWRVVAYNQNGTVAEEFQATNLTITNTEGGTLVNYLP